MSYQDFNRAPPSVSMARPIADWRQRRPTGPPRPTPQRTLANELDAIDPAPVPPIPWRTDRYSTPPRRAFSPSHSPPLTYEPITTPTATHYGPRIPDTRPTTTARYETRDTRPRSSLSAPADVEEPGLRRPVPLWSQPPMPSEERFNQLLDNYEQSQTWYTLKQEQCMERAEAQARQMQDLLNHMHESGARLSAAAEQI